MYRCVPETVSPEARAKFNMKMLGKVSPATFKFAYPHPFKFACQSYQKSFWEITFSIDPVLPPMRPRFHVITPPGIKVHTSRTSRVFRLLPLLLLLLILSLLLLLQKYRCVPKIAMPEARTYRCAAWYCCVQHSATMYPTPPWIKVGSPQPLPVGKPSEQINKPSLCTTLGGERMTFIPARYRWYIYIYIYIWRWYIDDM